MIICIELASCIWYCFTTGKLSKQIGSFTNTYPPSPEKKSITNSLWSRYKFSIRSASLRLTANDKAKNKNQKRKAKKKSLEKVERKQRQEKDAAQKGKGGKRRKAERRRQKGENKNKALDLSFLTYKWRNKSLDIVLNDAHTYLRT